MKVKMKDPKVEPPEMLRRADFLINGELHYGWRCVHREQGDKIVIEAKGDLAPYGEIYVDIKDVQAYRYVYNKDGSFNDTMIDQLP